MARSNKVSDGLTKTRRSFFGRIASLFQDEQITEETWEDLEMLLIQADVGVNTTLELVDTLREEADAGHLRSPAHAQDVLKTKLTEMLSEHQRVYLDGERMLNVVLIVGVNGAGKTTSIAKLARYHQSQGQSVMLVAADTFRAAAIDQLAIWAERVGVEIIAHQPGADPGAVVFDAIRAAQARNVDVLIIDTAGRLHNKFNLMKELNKLSGIASKQVHQAPHETLLVLDATTGQNALTQAKRFGETVDLTGVILAKLDSTAKGGMVLAIGRELGLPVQFVATGETLDDLSPFDAEAFVDGLFDND